MGTMLRQFIIRWLKNQFHGNPLVEQPGPYLQNVAKALSVGWIGAAVLVLLGVVGSLIFITGALRGWF